jgi:hypothetical protein
MTHGFALRWRLDTVRTASGLHVLIHLASDGERMETHDTDGLTCWCAPVVRRCCPECEDARAAGDDAPDCWRCDGLGTVPCEAPALDDGPHPLMVAHNARPRP